MSGKSALSHFGGTPSRTALKPVFCPVSGVTLSICGWMPGKLQQEDKDCVTGGDTSCTIKFCAACCSPCALLLVVDGEI